MTCELCSFPGHKLDVEDTTFTLCHNHLLKLVLLSLSSDEALKLMQKHGCNTFYLHNDFYDEYGNALQPKYAVFEVTCASFIKNFSRIAKSSSEIEDELENLWDNLSLSQKLETNRGPQERAKPPSNDYTDFSCRKWVPFDKILEILKK